MTSPLRAQDVHKYHANVGTANHETPLDDNLTLV